MEEDEAVEVRVVRREVAGAVHRVEVLDVRADLERGAEAVLDEPAEGVRGRARRQRELVRPVGHGLGADEVEVEGGAREQVGELGPDVAREGGFGARAEDEEPDRGGVGADTLNVEARARAGRV